MWSTGEGNGQPLQYSCLENPMNSMRRQNDRTLKEELPRSVGAQYATGDQWRNNSRKNEGMEPRQEQYPVMDVTGDRSKVRCCKEQYCIGTWNVRSMNQGNLRLQVVLIGSNPVTGVLTYSPAPAHLLCWLFYFTLPGPSYKQPAPSPCLRLCFRKELRLLHQEVNGGQVTKFRTSETEDF